MRCHDWFPSEDTPTTTMSHHASEGIYCQFWCLLCFHQCTIQINCESCCCIPAHILQFLPKSRHPYSYRVRWDVCKTVCCAITLIVRFLLPFWGPDGIQNLQGSPYAKACTQLQVLWIVPQIAEIAERLLWKNNVFLLLSALGCSYFVQINGGWISTERQPQ